MDSFPLVIESYIVQVAENPEEFPRMARYEKEAISTG